MLEGGVFRFALEVFVCCTIAIVVFEITGLFDGISGVTDPPRGAITALKSFTAALVVFHHAGFRFWQVFICFAVAVVV